MLFSWFDTTAVNRLADALVADMQQRLPAAVLATPRRGAKDEARLKKLHEQALVRVVEFTRQQRPNFWQKARLAHRVRWGLTEAGYPASFVDEFAYELAAVSASANSQNEV